MPELTVILDAFTGAVLVEAPDHLPRELRDELTVRFGPGAEMGCARPLVVLPPPVVPEPDLAATVCMRVVGHSHNSLVEGPGRRTSLLVSGCTLGCRNFIYSLARTMVVVPK